MLILKWFIMRWYFSLFIIPLLINYFTDFVSIETIFNNWEFSIISVLSILTGLLIYELIKVRRNEIVVNEHDQRIIIHLFNTLNLDLFQKDIYEQDSWHGYAKEAIYSMLNFREEARLLKNRFADGELNNLMGDFLSSLDNFNDVAASSVYGKDEVWLQNIHAGYDNEKRRESSIKMNNLAKDAYLKLEDMILYLKKNKIKI